MRMNLYFQLFLILVSTSLLPSCSLKEIGQNTQKKAEEGWSYLVEKGTGFYETGKNTLGLDSPDQPDIKKKMTISKRVFGQLADGSKVHEFRLINENGVEVSILEFGAAVREIILPDRDGKLENVSLGFSSLDDYLSKSPYFGCIAGRYANRIAAGQFSLDGIHYQLATNNGANHLHGGLQGFDKRVWAGKAMESDLGVVFNYVSPDGEEGYPGRLITQATYILTSDNELKIQIKATSDKPTIVNLTNHTYFNLSGAGESSILNHQLTLPGKEFVATDASGIPSGFEQVMGTPFDFRRATRIGSRIDQDHAQLIAGKGYDHTWLVPKGNQELNWAATLKDSESGRCLQLFTNQPGIQFYSGNYLDGSLVGSLGESYPFRSGLCLEPQLFPDSPNHEGQDRWPSSVLRPGETYFHSTVYKFSVE